MEEIIKAKIKYLEEMLDKYENLNKVTNDKYRYRSTGLCDELDVLESIIDNKPNDNWNEAYEEDLMESRRTN